MADKQNNDTHPYCPKAKYYQCYNIHLKTGKVIEASVDYHGDEELLADFMEMLDNKIPYLYISDCLLGSTVIPVDSIDYIEQTMVRKV